MMADRGEMDIVVVDDDEGHTELIRRNLRRIGVTNSIVTLDSGQAALDYVFSTGSHAGRPQNGYLLILLDIKMPGACDGVDVLRRIKADPVKKRIPVIMLTTTDDPREVKRCYDLGCSVYVTKPVEPLAFIEAIRRLGLFLAIVNVPPEGGTSS
jgi:CheY-like chemotaxis protein